MHTLDHCLKAHKAERAKSIFQATATFRYGSESSLLTRQQGWLLPLSQRLPPKNLSSVLLQEQAGGQLITSLAAGKKCQLSSENDVIKN